MRRCADDAYGRGRSAPRSFHRALDNAGIQLAQLGRAREALAHAHEAVAIYRHRAQTEPESVLPALAGALNNLGLRLGELSLRREALVPAGEAIQLYRWLVRVDEGTYLPDLAMALSNLAMLLMATRADLHAAGEAAREAVNLYNRLDRQHPGVFGADLRAATGLHTDLVLMQAGPLH